jgi:DNA-binding transcriptional LysR family regulator
VGGRRPRLISDEDIEVIVAAARTRPEKLRQPFTPWSLRKLADYLAAHRLAGKEYVSLADEHLLQHSDIVPEWRDVAAEMRGRRRLPPPRFTHTVEEKLEQVAIGRGIVVLPESAASMYTRPGICYIPISDIPPAETCLAWSSSRRSPLLPEFARLAEQYPVTA